MRSVKGTLKNGLVYPSESIEEQNGESGIITFVEKGSNTSSTDDLSWDSEDWEQFDRLIENCTVDTGIEDLAHQHDRYIHGTPKRKY
jgi:hypothetical protein